MEILLLLLKPKSVTTYLQHITYAYASSLKEHFAQTKRKFKNLNLSKTCVYLRIIYRSNAFYINPSSLWLIQQSGVVPDRINHFVIGSGSFHFDHSETLCLV